MSFLSKIFGSNEREIVKIKPLVGKINSFVPAVAKLSDEELKNKTSEFGERLEKGETKDDLLPEAFAVVREVSGRVIQERHYDVQLLGGIVLHQGKIAEMKTGEGKTLTATLSIYLNSLDSKGVHVVTVNDYLAKRDCNWMGAIFHRLGLSTSCIVHGTSYIYEPKIIDLDNVTVEAENLKSVSRKDAYAADITYGTNNEFGFDYLRDNMAQNISQMVQRGLNYAIVDEVDSILIDEARTPLIISAPDTESTKLYQQFARVIPRLKEKEHYQLDEKQKAVALTEKGMAHVEEALGVGNIYEAGKMSYVHHLEQSLKAHVIFKRDRDYVVKDGEVIIVDDFTGRLMVGRRYSEGLHQAIEAKEGVEVQKESRTLATITFQNYFRMYKKLAGMTGTAITSAEEFAKVYKLEVTEIPTNKPMIRTDLPDIIYKTETGKFQAIVEKIKEIHATKQPVLVGTIAIEKSEYLSALLEREGIPHQVLNAKHHEKEAMIIAGAGQNKAVTIATNMAGRGTDIKLGPDVKELRGLFILGTERHEARRIDNQLRGRSGRQGDPGMSQFFVSLEDELIRRFGGDRIKNMMDSLGLPENEPIQNKIISKSIESAQNKIEGFNFDIRKHVLEYDDVMNKQREVIYKKRHEILEKSEIKNEIFHNISEELEKIISFFCVGGEIDWNVKGMISEINSIFALKDEDEKQLKLIRSDKSKNEAEKKSLILEYLTGVSKKIYAQKEKEIGGEVMRKIEKAVALQTIDNLWMNHLDDIDNLRTGIGLRGYGQRDPLVEYKRETFNLFSNLIENIRQTIIKTIFKISVAAPAEDPARARNLQFKGADENVGQFQQESERENFSHVGREQKSADRPQSPIINKNKVGRNDPCPCNSGKKYKKCHGK